MSESTTSNFSRKKHQDITHYYINKCLLQEVCSVRDLGVAIDSSLNFKNHYGNIINKASKLAGFIVRETNLTIFIYYSYIRSILEYYCVA